MLDLKLRVKLENQDEWSLPVTIPVLIDFEEHFNIDAGTALSSGVRLQYLAYLAWASAKRHNKTVSTFEKFAEEIESIEADDDSKPLADTP